MLHHDICATSPAPVLGLGLGLAPPPPCPRMPAPALLVALALKFKECDPSVLGFLATQCSPGSPGVPLQRLRTCNRSLFACGAPSSLRRLVAELRGSLSDHCMQGGRACKMHLRTLIQGERADKKLARGEVPPLLLKIDGVVGLETALPS
jgi:hypothetical protein